MRWESRPGKADYRHVGICLSPSGSEASDRKIHCLRWQHQDDLGREDVSVWVFHISTYPDSFYAQINALCTKIPVADSSEVQSAGPESPLYLLKLLSQHPGHIGFQMLSSAFADPARVDKAKGCPSADLQCVLEGTASVALTYKPYFIEYWHRDIEDPRFQDALKDISRSLETIGKK